MPNMMRDQMKPKPSALPSISSSQILIWVELDASDLRSKRCYKIFQYYSFNKWPVSLYFYQAEGVFFLSFKGLKYVSTIFYYNINILTTC